VAEFFIRPDGTESTDPSDRVSVASTRANSARLIAQAWLRVTRIIPPQFAVGSALHESSYTLNEHDVEPNGHETGGLFQLDVPSVSAKSGVIVGAAIETGMVEKSVYVLDDACAMFASICTGYLNRILREANAYRSARGFAPFDPSALPGDVWAYVAIAHNQGIGAAVETIQKYGLNWSGPNGYKARNGDNVNISAARAEGVYGDDVLTGGPDWEEGFSNPFDDTGARIAAPTLDAATSTRMRLGLLALLLLLLVFWLTTQQRSPLKGIL